MIVVKCDGHKFSGEKCTKEEEVYLDEMLPFGWIQINGIKNNHQDAHTITSGKPYHFCSKKCLNDTLFKNTKENEKFVLYKEENGIKYYRNGTSWQLGKEECTLLNFATANMVAKMLDCHFTDF